MKIFKKITEYLKSFAVGLVVIMAIALPIFLILYIINNCFYIFTVSVLVFLIYLLGDIVRR